VGAIYDLVAPTKDTAKKDEWNKLEITAKGSKLVVKMNGEKINEIDLDRWTEGGKNPDGTKNKFSTALKDFKREGHIGFQDHGADVMYRNIAIRSP
jgi:3-keto-disaccharide hydrolase